MRDADRGVLVPGDAGDTSISKWTMRIGFSFGHVRFCRPECTAAMETSVSDLARVYCRRPVRLGDPCAFDGGGRSGLERASNVVGRLRERP